MVYKLSLDPNRRCAGWEIIETVEIPRNLKQRHTQWKIEENFMFCKFCLCRDAFKNINRPETIGWKQAKKKLCPATGFFKKEIASTQDDKLIGLKIQQQTRLSCFGREGNF